MRVYNKLVRDNIPEIIAQNGEKAITYILNDEQYRNELKKKLLEEVNEYLESGELAELADITEVVDALATAAGSSFSEVQELKHNKVLKNGAFRSRIFLERVEENDASEVL